MTCDDKSYKWCGVCRRWHTGAKAHYTREHVKKDKTSTPAPASTQANMAAASRDDDDFPFDSSLSMVGGFFGGVVPVTKATFRAKDWRACTKCRANVHRSHDCTGTYRHQQGRVMDAVDDSVDFV